MIWTVLALGAILMVIGVPVGFVLLAVSAAYVIYDPSLLELAFAQNLVMGTQSFPLLAIPLFILTGELMNISGIARRVFVLAAILTQRMVGGLAQLNIVLSALLSGMSGSANGDAAMQSKMLVPEMVRNGYPAPYAAVVTAMSSLIAPMIPPGIGLIMFGFVTNTSIGDMFMAGILPGILLTVVLMGTTHFISARRRFRGSDEVFETSLGKAFLGALPALGMPIVVVGGIRLGIFTPSEGAGVAVVYALIFCLVFRETSGRAVLRSVISTAVSTAAIMLILAGSTTFSWVLTYQGIPQQLAAGLIGVTENPAIMLAIVAGFVLLAGLFIEGTALIIIAAPMLLPVTNHLGIDPLHFGIVFVFMAHLGGVTPPVGTIMFTTCAITKVRVSDFVGESWPYIGALLVAAAILILVPEASTWLGHL